LDFPGCEEPTQILTGKTGHSVFEKIAHKHKSRILEKTRRNHWLMRVVHLPKATAEEIPDKEAMPETLPDTEPIGPQDHPEELVQPTSPPPTKEVTPLSTEETTLEEIADDELLIAYIRGEPVIGIFEPVRTLLTKEYKEPLYSYSTKKVTISWLIKSNDSPQYAYSQNVWIRVKISISQRLAHKSEKDQETNEKTLDELLPDHYKDYRKVFEKTALECFPESKP
jgi:hypothetical protein